MEYKEDYKKQKNKPEQEVPKIDKNKKKDGPDQPFRPAALKKCDPFNPDSQVYAEEKQRLKKFYEVSKIVNITW